MKTVLRAMALLLVLCATAFSAEYRAGVLLVKYRPGTDEAAITELQGRKGMTLTKKIKLFGIHVYSFDESKGSPVAFAEEVAREAIVLNAEPDLIREAKSADPEYPNQWSLHNTGQVVNGKTGPAGIDIRWPAANLIYRPKSSLLVAVVDSGVTLLHPDLVDSIHAKPGENGPAFNNGLDDDDNGLVDDVWGYDWYSFDPLPLDQNGHGTLVASIIAGTIGNSKGISGITNSVKIRSFRIFDQFGRGGRPKFRTASAASISDSLAAIATAVEDGCKILNLSYGGEGYSQLEADAYHDLRNYDVLLIVAAGNEANHNDQTPTYPASYQAACIISVAAQDRTGGLASFSNYGPISTDLAAPGTDIRGADVTRRTIYFTGFSSGMSGWSAYRNTATDYSYAAWTMSGGYLVDRTYGSTYAPWTDTFARSPLIDASAYSGVRVEYEGMYDLANDRGSVDLSLNGSSWDSYSTFTSFSEGFERLDASDYDFSKFYLRFRLQSDGYSQGIGIAVQGVKVTAINDLDVNNPSYQYNNGTSFAAPVVAGVAAMVWTHQPSLTAAQVKEVLFKSVRKMPALEGKVLTGGMVDAEAALKLADVYAGDALPSVVTPPRGGFFLQGNSLSLSVVSTPGLPVTYQWRKNGVNISGARGATFVIGVLEISDSGNYDVAVTSQAGTVISGAAQVTVAAKPPGFTAHPVLPAAVMVAGESYQLSCSVSGTAPFAYQWLRAGIAIPSATSASFTLNALKTTDAGVYTVRVSNAAGFVTSQPVTVSVSVRPAFTTNLPATATVLTGATRTLAVAATGTPLPTYQWRKDGVDILNARLASYVVPATTVPTTATYSVVITNAAGSLESTPCQLSSVSLVSVPVSGQPQARNVVAGQSASFTVTPAGTGPFTYQWLKRGVVIAGATSQTYTIASVSALDVASYSARVTNGAGTATSLAATLSVLGFKTDLPATATVLTGATRTLAVVATGSPLPTYQWRKDGVDIPNARLASYVVPVTSVPTTATYSVVITNAAGSLESTLCQLSPVTIVSVPNSGQPQARNLKVGDSASFTVTPAGTGPFTYQWLRNGVVIAGATSQTYTIPLVSAADAAKYSVRVSNGAGTATSVAATLSVLGFKTDLPATATVLTGATRTLAVVATGAPLPTYQWRKDGVDIPNARLASYVVPATTVPTTATYSVVITNAAGSVESTACILSSVTAVTVPVSGQPQARNVVAGQSASFTVTPAGTGPFTYQWLKNGVIIAGATSQEYAIAAVSALDAAAYSVRISNGASTVASLAAALKVITPFTITAQPNAGVGTMALAAGTSKALTVTASGVGPFTYQWRKDGQPIAGATLASYLVQAGSTVVSVVYDVVITGPVSATSSSAVRVDTVLPPSFLQHPASIARALGQPATFSVSMGGTGPFTYQWLKNRIAIAGATSVSYTVGSVVATSPGNYSVRVIGPGGSATSLTGTLSLQAAPVVSAQPANQYKAAGQSVTFSVAATGTGPLSYQWSKDGTPILGANSASYYIAAVSAEHVGRYSVSVSNAVGSVLSQEAELAIVTSPSIVTQPTLQPFVPKLPQEHRVRYFGFKDGPEGWSVSTTQAEYEDAWGAPAWYWNSYLDEIPADPLAANLQGGFGGVVTSPRISLSGITNAELRFKCMAAGTGLAPDPGTLTIEASVDGTTWIPLFSKSNDSAITPHVVSLSAFAGNGCYVRAVTSANCDAYLDEVEIWGYGLPSNSATLTVGATGGGLSYQWLKNGVAIAGANQAQYVVTDVYASGAPGTYSVRVTNAAGSTTSGPATLGVLPGISTQPVALSKAAGQSAVFSVAAVGTGPLSYQWRKDGAAIIGATSPTYSITAVGSQYVGSYSVLVFNSFGQVTSQSVPLNVVTMPVITGQPQSYAYSYPANVRADVVAYRFTQGPEGWGPVGEGYPGWMWNDQSLPSEGNDPDASSLEGNGYVRSPMISLAGLTSCSVDFDINAYGGNCNLDVSVDGASWSTVYTYDGSNFGNAGVKTVSLSAYDGRSVYLRFYMPPSGAALLDDIEVSGVSRGHVMSVGVSGAGFTYQWFRNGVAIAGATSTSYRVSDVALAASAGSYTVRVTNAAGTVTSMAAVIPVFPKPVIVSQPTSLSILGPTSSPYTVRNYTFTSGAEGWTYGSNLGNQSAYHWDWDSSVGGITDRLYGSTYASYTDTYTQSPWISLLGVSSTMLYFTAYHELFPDLLDALDVQASSDGVYWTTLRSIYGNGNGVYSVSLAGYQWSGCYLRYRLKSSPLYNAFGVVIYDTIVSGFVVSLGQSATFSVGLSSVVGCTFQWYKDNVAISGANSSTYYIANAYASDGGAYKVIVTNPVGSVTSNFATLTVR